jgi:hypothetical protein
MIVAAFLTAAILVSFWQVRGTFFSLPFATIPLSLLIGTARRRAYETSSTRRQLVMAAAWIVSLNLIWQFAAAGVLAATEGGDESAEKAEQCYKNADYAILSGLPSSTVLAVSNLGTAILRHTPHRVLAGPYHRNMDGNRATLDAFIGPLDASREIVRANGIGLLAFCRGNPETGFLSESAPNGLLAKLVAGDPPDWLEIVPESKGKPLEIYRVVPGS